MKKSIIFKFITSVAAVSALFCGLSVGAKNVYSEHYTVPNDSYTYWNTGDNTYKTVNSKPLYELKSVYEYEELGGEKNSVLADVTVSDDGIIMLLDSKNSCITLLSSDYSILGKITNFSGTAFQNAKSIFVAADGLIYVADTEHSQVLIGNRDGVLIRKLELPDSKLIPDDFEFKPIRVTVDRNGYAYVLSDGSYYGAILYSPDGEFLSFFGANSVTSTVTQAISKMWEKLTMTNEKRSKQVSKLPYQFTDLYVDKDNFIYTATGKTKNGQLQTGVVRMLSPSGSNILSSDSKVFGERQIFTSGNVFEIKTQNISGIAVDDYGFMYVFDTSYGRIYIYDSECNMLGTLGGGFSFGEQKGTYKQISAIDICGNDLLVTDSMKNTLTVYSLNDYGKNVLSLQRMTLDGDYVAAKSGWEQVVATDGNSRVGIVGLAKAAYTEGDYKQAMSLAKSAYDRDTYSLAFKEIRKDFLHRNFVWIFLSVILVLVLAAVLLHEKKKKNLKLLSSESAKVFVSAAAHPADSFTQIKQKHLISMKWCWLSLALYYVSVAVQGMFGSFVFVADDASSFNSIIQLARSVGLVLVWTVTNWAACTLFGGIGKMKEIFTVVTYSLVPMTFGNFLYTLVTHIMTPDEAAFMSVITVALTLYSVIMIIIGTMIVHDFSFGRFIGTSLLTVFGIAVIVFVGIIIIILVQQLVAFLSTVMGELIYR